MDWRVAKGGALKRTAVVTAKTLECYADLIARGIKRHEVRSESLDGVDAIHLVSAETGAGLGTAP